MLVVMQELQGQAAAGGGAVGILRDPIRVLVAERDLHLRTVLSWLLRHDERFRVVGETDDGDVAAAWPGSFEVALVDLTLSGLGGPGTLAALRLRTPPPEVVVLSCTDAVYLRRAAEAEGAARFLVRPHDLEALPDLLAAVVPPFPSPRAP